MRVISLSIFASSSVRPSYISPLPPASRASTIFPTAWRSVRIPCTWSVMVLGREYGDPMIL